MTFKTAQRELSRLAKGEYRALKYELTFTDKTHYNVVCSVYIHGYGLYNAKTWKEALASLRISMQKPKKRDIKEAPIGAN